MSVNASVKKVRTNYTKHKLEEANLPNNPILLFEAWLQLALDTAVEPNAMMLSTHGLDGFPQSRIVLLREVSMKGLVFFTNYQSNKGKELAKNAKVSATFFWPQQEKQVRIKGVASKISEKESDAYFTSRPRSSQLGAWASHQSQELTSRKDLEKRLEKLDVQYQGKEVPRPAHWGGYCIIPNQFEFWQGRDSRLHDRIVFKEGGEPGQWQTQRLNP